MPPDALGVIIFRFDSHLCCPDTRIRIPVRDTPIRHFSKNKNMGIRQYIQQQQQQQHSLFSQASWGRLEMKPERNKFKVQAH